MSNCKTCIYEKYCSIANGNLSNKCTKYRKKKSSQTTTYIKIFQGDSYYLLERESNEHAKENNVDIISTSIAVRPFDHVSDDYVLSVVYRKKIKSEG